MNLSTPCWCRTRRVNDVEKELRIHVSLKCWEFIFNLSMLKWTCETNIWFDVLHIISLAYIICETTWKKILRKLKYEIVVQCVWHEFLSLYYIMDPAKCLYSSYKDKWIDLFDVSQVLVENLIVLSAVSFYCIYKHVSLLDWLHHIRNL